MKKKHLAIPRHKESVLRGKLLYTGIIIFVYILGRCIPLYGVAIPENDWNSMGAEQFLLQTIAGGAQQSSIFALGISPYMIASILTQLVMACVGSVTKARISPKKVSRATVSVVLVVSFLQAFSKLGGLEFTVAGEWLPAAKAVAALELVAGSMVILWLGGRIAKYGLGGRMSLGLVNILEGITATLAGHSREELLRPLAVSLVVVVIIVIMENTEKRIPVLRISIHNIYADKNYLAIKLNPVGVMPVMFSTALFSLLKLLISLLRFLLPDAWQLAWLEGRMALSDPFGIAVYIFGIFLLCIVFSMVMISPKDMTEQFLKSGDCIVNLHAGRDTRRYLRGVVWRISLFSSIVMGTCMAVPLTLQLYGRFDSALVMLPSSVMMLTGLWCNLFREAVSIWHYDSSKPLL